MNPHVTLMTDADVERYVASAGPAGFGVLNTSKGRLPLRALDVQARIDGLLAETTVRQTFVNPYDEPLEVTYIYPLPDRAAVTRFQMEVAGRIVDGVLKERGQARRDYARAIKAGHRAAITEEDRPSTFNLRVGNLMPGEQAVVQLTLVGPLPFSDGEATFRFPLVVAPRYIPGNALDGTSVGGGVVPDTDAVPDASRITPPVLLPGLPNAVALSIGVELHDGGLGVREVCSSLQAVVEELDFAARRIRLEPGERLDRDFILRFRVATAAVQTALTLRPDDTGSEGTFLLTLVPPATPTLAPRPRDIVFVLDRSGSMEGWKMIAARRALARMVDTLTEHDRFSVLAFDDRIEWPAVCREGRLAAGTDRNRFRAVEFLARVESRNGTEMNEPLARAAELLQGDDTSRDRVLVLVTDGQVGNEDEILQTLGPKLRRIRVFTLGIDQAVNEGFLRRLAQLGGGRCELVESEDRLDAVMEQIHRCIGTPLIAGVNLEPAGIKIVPESVTPARLPDLFAGAPLFLFGRYRGHATGALVVAGKAHGKPWSQRVSATAASNLAVPCVWARGRLRDLEDRYVTDSAHRHALQTEILETSLRFGVLCRFTAFVAVDHAEVVNPGGKLHRATQPVEPPAGWAKAQQQTAPLETVDLTGVDIAPSVIAMIPESVARENIVLPLGQDQGTLIVIVSNPHDLELIEKLQFILNRNIVRVLADRAQILDAINRHYGVSDQESVDEMMSEYTDTAIPMEDGVDFELTLDDAAAGGDGSQAVALESADSDLECSDFDLALEEDFGAGEACSSLMDLSEDIPLEEVSDGVADPAVQFVNRMILVAIARGATTIYLEPLADRVLVRFRVPHDLVEHDTPPLDLYPAIVACIKRMACVEAVEAAGASRGVIELVIGGNNHRMFVRTLPTALGEVVVIDVQ